MKLRLPIQLRNALLFSTLAFTVQTGTYAADTARTGVVYVCPSPLTHESTRGSVDALVEEGAMDAAGQLTEEEDAMAYLQAMDTIVFDLEEDVRNFEYESAPELQRTNALKLNALRSGTVAALGDNGRKTLTYDRYKEAQKHFFDSIDAVLADVDDDTERELWKKGKRTWRPYALWRDDAYRFGDFAILIDLHDGYDSVWVGAPEPRKVYAYRLSNGATVYSDGKVTFSPVRTAPAPAAVYHSASGSSRPKRRKADPYTELLQYMPLFTKGIVSSGAISKSSQVAELLTPSGATTHYWKASYGLSNTWTEDGAWRNGTFASGDHMQFLSDDVAGAADVTITLGSDVNVNTLKHAGEDNYTLDLDGNTLTVGAKVEKTGSGVLSLRDGDLVLENKAVITANKLEFHNVDITDNNGTGEGNVISITDQGSLLIDGGTADLVKINANNNYNYKQTHITFTNGAQVTMKRDSSLDNSALEAEFLDINGGATLAFTGRDSLKVNHVTVSGAGSTLNLINPLLKPNKTSGGVYWDDVELVLADGALLNNSRADGAKLDLTGYAKLSPNLDIKLNGGGSYVTGDWAVSRIKSLSLQTEDSFLTIGKGTETGGLDIANTITGTLTLAGSTLGAGQTEFTVFRAAEGSSISINGELWEAGADYLAATKFDTVVIGDTTVTGNSDYIVQLVKKGNDLVVRLVDPDHGPADSPYIWSNADGATLGWSNAGWDERIWYSGSSVRLVTDGVAGAADTTVKLHSDVNANEVEISGEDNYTLALGSNTLTAASLSKSGTGALTITGDTVAVAGGAAVNGGSVVLRDGGRLTAGSITLATGSTLDIQSGSRLALTGALDIAGGTVQLQSGGNLAADSLSVTDGGSLSITSPYELALPGGMAVDNGGVQLYNNVHVTTDRLSVTNGGGVELTDLSWINAAGGVTIDGGSVGMLRSSKLYAESVVVKNGGRLAMSVPNSLAGLNDKMDLTLSNGAILEMANASIQTLAAKTLTLEGATSYTTGSWTLSFATTGTVTFKDADSYITIGTAEENGRLDLSVTNNPVTLKLGEGVLTPGKTDYILFRESENGTLTLGTKEVEEYKDYLATAKIDTIMAGNTTLTGDSRYDLHLVRSGSDLVLRVIDKRNAATEYVWSNGDGGHMGWSSFAWDAGSYYADPDHGPTVKFISDGVEGAASTTVCLKSDVNAGTMQVSGEDDFTFSQASYLLTLDNLQKSGSGTLTFNGNATSGSGVNAAKNITVKHTVDITEGGFVLGEGMKLTTETINVADGARFTLSEGATLHPLPGAGNLNLSNGAILTSSNADVRVFAANNIDISGSTVYWTGDWRLDVGGVSTISFRSDGNGGGSYITIGKGAETGSLDLAPASDYSEFQISEHNWDATNTRTDYVLFHVSGSGSLTIGGEALQEHVDYIPTLKLNQISVVTPATDTAPLERIIENLKDNEQYNAFIINVGDDLLLRVVDKGHAVKEGGYTWNNADGAAMNWSLIGWQNEAWFNGSDAAFVSDSVAGVAGTTVTVKSDVTAGKITVSGEDDFTIQHSGSSKITARTLEKSGSGTLTVDKNTLTAQEAVRISGGTVQLTNAGALATPYLQIGNATLVVGPGSQLNSLDPARTMELALDGATLVNTGEAIPFRDLGSSNLSIVLTPTGTASRITGQWRVHSNFTLDASAADFVAPVIGGDADLYSLLHIYQAGFSIDLGDKWNGTDSLAERIKLFEVADNANLRLYTSVLSEDVTYNLGLGECPLSGVRVNYNGGSKDLTEFSDLYHSVLSYESGSLYLNIIKKGEYVWSNTDGGSMTWSRNNWGATDGSAGTDYFAYEHVRFTNDADLLNAASTTITINGVGNTASDEDKTQNTLYIGRFIVEGDDNFTFNISGRLQMTDFEKHGSGTATFICDTEEYRPVFKVLNGGFTVDGGTLNAAKTQLEIEQGRLIVDGSENAASLIAKFQTDLSTGAYSINLKNSDMVVTGANATADVFRVVNSDSGNGRSTLSVSNGATLTISPVPNSKGVSMKGYLTVQDVSVRNNAVLDVTANGIVKARTYTITDGGKLSLTMGKGNDLTFTPYTGGADISINLANGGILKNGRDDDTYLKLNDAWVTSGGTTTYSKVQITLTGAASVLEGNWELNAARSTVIAFANADTSALSIRNGTLNITNTNEATETSALIFDLTGVWDGASPITHRLFRTVTGGDLTLNGNAIAAGDVTSQFQNVYVRYGKGADQIINLSDASSDPNSPTHYQLLWQNGSLFFTQVGQDENGPFIWRHSFEQEYAPVGSSDPRRLTWSVGEIWRPASDSFGGPSGADCVPAARYKDGYAVSFVGDTDGVVDDVNVTIVGRVAPGDSTQGEAGVRITGADNYTFTSGLTYRHEGEIVNRIEDPEHPGEYIFCKLDDDYNPVTNGEGRIITYDPATVTSAYEAEICDLRTGNSTVLPTTLSKSGTGTLFFSDDVKLTYTGRTEVLEGKMHVDSLMWSPGGIISVAPDAVLQVGKDAYMGTRQANVLSIGSGMVDNNGLIHTNIVLPTGATVTGNGKWVASYFNLLDSSFHAGSIEMQQLVVTGYGNASLVANNSDVTLSQYFAGAGQNITLMNRGTMTVEGARGADATHAAVEAYNVIISGAGSALSLTGGGALRAEVIDITHGATLSLGKALEHVDGRGINMTLAYGSTLSNNTTKTIVLNPNNEAPFNFVVKAADDPNYFVGNWTVDLSHPFELDFSHFDNSTTVVPIVVRDGTMTLANANRTLDEATELADFVFRADGLHYDTIELMTVGERGKIAVSLVKEVTESGRTVEKTFSTVLANNTDYFNDLNGMGYWFHVDAKGNDTMTGRPGTWTAEDDFYVSEDGWRYVDLRTMKSFDSSGNVVTLTDDQFARYTGLTEGMNFKLLFESNTLSLVLAPDGPIGTRSYYFWSGRSESGSDQGDYETWTRHNSVELSPWSGDDIFQNGYLTIFADVDVQGRKIGSYTVEIENSVATGSAKLDNATRPGYFENACIYFGNRSVAEYVLQSEKYHGSGSIADMSPSNLTHLIVEGGFVEIKTANTYGGKLNYETDDIKHTTKVVSRFVDADDCLSVSYCYTDAEGGEHTHAKLTDLNVQQAREAHLVNYSRYSYAYRDKAGEVHFITADEYNNGSYAQYNPERVYITQRSDGSNTWSVRGDTIPMTVKENLAVVYSTDIQYAYAYTTTDALGKSKVHFISQQDWQSGAFANQNVMEVIITPEEGGRSWHVNGNTIFATVSESSFDSAHHLYSNSETHAYAYVTESTEMVDGVETTDRKINFISEGVYNAWNAWVRAEDEDMKASCLAALQAADRSEGKVVAAYAIANPLAHPEDVRVVRTVNSTTNVDDIRWAVGNDDIGTFTVDFSQFAPNQVYAFQTTVGGVSTVHVLTETEYEAWQAGEFEINNTVVDPSDTSIIKAVSVFGPFNGRWNLYTTDSEGNRTVWATTSTRPTFIATENAYLRTKEDQYTYAYETVDAESGTQHIHFLTQTEYEAWTSWAAATDPTDKAEKLSALTNMNVDLAYYAQMNPDILPEQVFVTRYEQEQAYRVQDSGVHGTMSTLGMANNYSYAYAVSSVDAEGQTVQDIGFVTREQCAAWRAWTDVAGKPGATAAEKEAAFNAFADALGDKFNFTTQEQKDAWREWAMVAYDSNSTASDLNEAFSTFKNALGEEHQELANTALSLVGANPERVDVAYLTSINPDGTTITHWGVQGANIADYVDSMEGSQNYGSLFMYAYKGADDKYHIISSTEREAWMYYSAVVNNPDASEQEKADAYTGLVSYVGDSLAATIAGLGDTMPERVDMKAVSHIEKVDGTVQSVPEWSYVTENGEAAVFTEQELINMNGRVYGYAYNVVDKLGRTHIHFVSPDELEASKDRNPLFVVLSMEETTPGSYDYQWVINGGQINQVVDLSNLAGVETETRQEHYTYLYTTTENVLVDGLEVTRTVSRFISERDYKDGNLPDGVSMDDIHKLVIVKQADGKWYVPEMGYTMSQEGLEVTVDTNELFGYGYYDERGQIHFATQDTYYKDNNSKLDIDDSYKSPLGNTQLIRLVYDEKTKQWYTPGVLLASNEQALGTSEVLIGTGSRLLATTNLRLTSLTMEQGANVIARQDLAMNKPFTVSENSYFEVDGLLSVSDITVKNGAHFLTHDVKADNVTLETGAIWNLNENEGSQLDIKDRLVMYGGSELRGKALMRDGLLEVLVGDADNPDVLITGDLKLGVDATLDLTKLMPEGAARHYRSPLRVSDGGSLVLEPHAGLLLSMAQVNHLLDAHNDEIPQESHVMHIATLGAGANFYITTQEKEGDIIVSTQDVMLPLTDATSYADMPGNVLLAEGLGYLVDATLIRRHSSTGSNTGYDEVVLHLSNKADSPMYVWNGVYNGYNAAGNDNLWCMYNGGTLEADNSITTDSHAWSAGAIYGDPGMVDPDKPYENWGNEVYFLEVGRDSAARSSNFVYHYVNAGDKAEDDLTYRSKYVDIRGEVWSKTITVDVDRTYDMTLEQYLRNVGYMFYSSDGTGTITDSWAHYDYVPVYNEETGEWDEVRVLTGTCAMGEHTQLEADASHGTIELQRTQIVKNGTGVLTLNTENSFTGAVYLNSGSVFATNEKALGGAHVMMQDQTGLYINYLFEMKGDSNYRNPVLTNDITVWGGGNFAEQQERALGGDRIISVTVGYNPISVIDVMCDLNGTTANEEREESTSRHWRTLSIVGELHGGKNTEIRLQGYTSYTGSQWYTSMFHIYGTAGLSDFAGTIKLENYRNSSPAAYSDRGDFMNDTNEKRGTGALELMISDATLQYATLDLTRQNVLSSYETESHEKGFGRRQTPTHVVLMLGDAAVAGLNAEFLGTIVCAERGADGAALSSKAEILAATQAQELASVRTISTGNYTLSLHSDEMYDYVYSGVLGGQYAYAGNGSGTIPEAGKDSTGAKISKGMVSLVHTGDGAQYVHTAYLQDLTIGSEAVGSYEKATGGTVGFHYLDLQGNLTLYSGATLKLDVDDCVRTANADGSQQNVHWDESAFSSSNVVLQGGRHATVVTSESKLGMISIYNKETGGPETVNGYIPVGSYIEGDLTVGHNAFLDFYSRSVEPLPMAEGGTSPDLIKQLTNPAFHPEPGVSITPPSTGYFLDITGKLILQGEVHVDFAGVEFGSAENGMTYYLARAQKGIIGTVNQQTISLGNGYYGIIRGLETYSRSISEIVLPGTVDNAQADVKFMPAHEIKLAGLQETDNLKAMDSLTSVRVYLTEGASGPGSYSFDYTVRLADTGAYETRSISLTQVSGNIYHYDVGDNSYDAVISTDLPSGGMVATLNLLDLAYDDSTGYIIMTVTNTPPRVWFNTDNVIDPVAEIQPLDADKTPIENVMLTPNGTRFANGAADGVYSHSAIGFGDTKVDTLWTSSSPDAHSWIDEHEAFRIGCRVQFNKYGTSRWQKIGDGMVYTRGYHLEEVEDGHGGSISVASNVLRLYDGDKEAYQGEYGMYVTMETHDGTKEVWRSMVAEMYGEQFDIVELEGDVQARSIFVNCETGIHDNDGNLLINSPRSGFVNYWFRSADTDDFGRIGDIAVSDINHDELTANNVYDVKLGQVLATTLEKTGGGYLRISTHNSYSGGTYLKAGSLIIDCDDALGKASSRQDAGGGDGALHAYDGSTLFLNYVDTGDTAKFGNDINVYANTAASAIAQQVGFTVVNGINLNGGSGNVHFVELNGAVIAADPDAVLTLSGLIVAENGKTYHDYTSFTLANLENYSGVVRLDSKFASNREGLGTVDGIVLDGDGQIVDYVSLVRKYYLTGNSQAVARAGASDPVDPDKVLSHYDEATRKISYFIDEDDGEGHITRTYLRYEDTYESFGKKPGDTGYNTYSADQVVTGGDVNLRVTGDTLGSAVLDLSLNSANHNALVLDMASNKLGGVRGLEGGVITYTTTQGASGEPVSGWQGYNSNVVSAKSGETILSLDISYGNALYAGTVGYGFYHATGGENAGLVHPSSAMKLEKTGTSIQSIYSARLDGLTLNQGDLQFVKDLILTGKLTIAKESQLIIGTPGTTTWNYNTTNGAPYSIVVQGGGILALGGAHTVEYKTTDNGRTFNTSTSWSAFTTAVSDYSEDMNTNMLLRGGTLTAITDVGTSMSATFANSFTIDTSHYDYESAMLADEGIEVLTSFADNHTITLSGRLFGSGVLTITGGGTVVFDKGNMSLWNNKENKVVGQMEAVNSFSGTSAMLIRVQDKTTLSLNKDSAVAYFGNGYKEEIHNGKHMLVEDGTSGRYQSASTLEIMDDSRAVVEDGVHAHIAAARFVKSDEDSELAGRMELSSKSTRSDGLGGTVTVDKTIATISLRTPEAQSYSLLSMTPPDPASGGDGSGGIGDGSDGSDGEEGLDPFAPGGLGGDPETLNMVNVEVASDNGKAYFTGIKNNRKENSINHNAQVTVSAGVEASMERLTLGSAAKAGGTAEADNTLVKLEAGASLKLNDVLIETAASVSGTTNSTGWLSSTADKELVELTNTTVNVVLGENLVDWNYQYTTEDVGKYGFDGDKETHVTGNQYYYSPHSLHENADQVIFKLTNFENCVITGAEGALTLSMSYDDYTALLLASDGGKKMLGFYMEGVAVRSDVVENLVNIVTTDADGMPVAQPSVFFVAANVGAPSQNGTVFYINTPTPEPTTATLSVVALAALMARRRRKRGQD